MVGLLAFASGGEPVLAQNSYIETEPNDTPQTAQDVTGPAVLMGAMVDGDQDAYLWSVSDEDAGHRWTLELQGIPGALTILEVVRLGYDDAGVLSAAATLLKLGSRDGQRPATADGLVFEPGEYLLGVARSGGSAPYRPGTATLSFGESGSGTAEEVTASEPGAYRVFLNAGARLPPSNNKPHADRQSARPVHFSQETTAFIEGSESVWYRLNVAEDQSASRWNIGIRIPIGRIASAALTDAEGTELAVARSAPDGLLTFVDTSLPVGRYFIEVAPVLQSGEAPGFVQLLEVVEVGQRVAGSEAEPNDRWSLANRAAGDACCTGRIGEPGDVDMFAFTIDEARADTLQRLVLETTAAHTMRLCLLDEKGIQIQCRQGAGGAELANLALMPGEYGVSALGIGATVDNDYALRFETAGMPQAGHETEPNDKQDYAVGTPENNRIRGNFDHDNDVDYYKFRLTDQAQLWRVQAIGDNIDSVVYHDAVGGQANRLNAAPGQRRVTLENLFLLPGTHYFSVTGRGAGDYTLLARALGPPDPNAEREPNDDATRMLPLKIGQTRTGLLSDPADRDRYRFSLAGWDHVVLTATPAVDGKLAAALEFAGTGFGEALQADGPIVLEGRLPPGDYQLTLRAREPSDAEYSLSLERRDDPSCAGDCEPNNNIVFASALEPDKPVTGQAGMWGDRDWFALPVFDSPQPVSIHFESDAGPALWTYDEEQKEIPFQFEQSTAMYTGTLPGGARTYAAVGRGQAISYTITLETGDQTPAAFPLPPLPVDLRLDTEEAQVSPYEPFGQTVGGSARLRNTGAEPLELELELSASDARWGLQTEADRVTLPSGGEQTLALEFLAPPDVEANTPVRVVVRAKAGDGRIVVSFVDIHAAPDALPAAPVHAWDIPPALRGGLNVARLDFGATATANPNPGNTLDKQLTALFDGRSVLGNGIAFRHRDTPQVVTVDLAGGDPIPVAGFALNPLYAQWRYQTPRDVEFQLSQDGETFTSVQRAELTTSGNDQFFVLDTPVPARFARLIMDNNWQGESGGPLTLGEWKVIAEPGVAPFDGGGLNIAAVAFGGHVIWSNRQVGRGGGWNINMLTDTQEAPVANVPPNEPLVWVLGFHHNRAAQIERIDFGAAPGTNDDMSELVLSASLESPLGPWRPVAEWSRADDGDALVLETPVWARFLRFAVPPMEDRRTLDLPDTLAVYEAPTSGIHRSVLSEWGYNSRSGYYESTLPIPPSSRLTRRGNESRDTADELPANQVETGRVQLKRQSQWYRPQLPTGHNTLTFTVTGDPTVRAELDLTAMNGESIVLRKLEKQSTPRRDVYEAVLETDRGTLLEVREPPRNVIFLWDTSPSMGVYLPRVYNSLQAYAEDLVPGYDMANLLPFGAARPLLQDWYGEPYLMQLILNDHQRDGGSSAAELTQNQAARALATRRGTRAIVMITDAHTSAYDDMWPALDKARPRIFTLHVGTQDVSQDLMQDWSSVNGGHYAYITDEGQMDVAFERAAAMLRGPVDYALTMTTEYREAPGPGYLRVVSGPDGISSAGSAVELILDASGSMLQRMDGRRRIEIAKEVLTQAIREQIPPGTPTALRVFGHRTPNACETDLEIPLEPLDPDAAVSTLASIQAKNLARTPIGDSLKAVPRDLGGSDRSALVLLVTDGEETCEGDPAAEIEKLKSSGFDVSLNIVGFAIDNPQLADQFAAWAQAGGGRYFAANDADGLTDAVTQALATTYTVYDQAGESIAQGTVDGEAVTITRGIYRVVVDSTPGHVFETVDVPGDSEVELEIGSRQ